MVVQIGGSVPRGSPRTVGRMPKKALKGCLCGRQSEKTNNEAGVVVQSEEDIDVQLRPREHRA